MQHFIVDEPMHFKHDDTLRATFVAGKIVGFHKLTARGDISILVGRMVDRPPLDPRDKAPLTVNDVQLYWGKGFH